MHAQLDAFGRAPRETEQLDAVAEFLGVGDVLGFEFGDALDVGALELHRNAERDRREQRDLVSGVDALDVEGRIGFRVAEALRFGQHDVERETLVAHFGEDEVARAVDDAGDPLDAVGGEAFAQRLDRRNAAGDGGFERDDHVLLARGREDLVSVQREQRFVGGDDVLAAHDRRQDRFFRDRRSADNLDHDVDVGVGDDGAHVVDDRDARTDDRARTLDVARGNHRDLDLSPRTAGDLLAVAFENVKGSAPNRSDAEQTDLDGFHLHLPSARPMQPPCVEGEAPLDK